MKGRNRSVAAKMAVRLLIWAVGITLCMGVVSYYHTLKDIKHQYAENCHMRMLINYEYARRVLSDVYVQVTNNVYYIENTLDKTESHIDAMARIVGTGNRVTSCGMNFIKSYYPEKGEKYCPFAWRNPNNPNEILTEIKGDKHYDYLNTKWFKSVIEGDTCLWSEPFYDGYDNTTELAAYMVPIHDKTGRPVAVLGADVSLEWLTSKMAETDSAYNAHAPQAVKMMGLKAQSFIINYDGTFITHQESGQRLEGVFYNYVLGDKLGQQTELEKKMKAGLLSENEANESYKFNGEWCYFFYTPLKYTHWMMVTVVPCQTIDMIGVMYALRIMAFGMIAMLILVAVAYVTMRKRRY